MTVRSPYALLRPTRRLASALGLAALLTTGSAAVAAAHVHVDSDSTTSGSFSELAFRVPNESATASTVKVSVELPTDKPFLSVSVRPLSGWDVSVTEATLPKPVSVDGTTVTKAVRTVTWTARTGTGIGPDEYQEFNLSVGPLPSPGVVLMPARQTMSDGSVVQWDQPTPASGVEPEHPAPSFTVTAAPGAVGHDSAGSASTGAHDESAATDTMARALGGIGVVLGLVAVGVAVAGRRRRPGDRGPAVTSQPARAAGTHE
jgi:uncharacterized protein YcnI